MRSSHGDSDLNDMQPWKIEQSKFAVGESAIEHCQEDTHFETNSMIAEISESFLNDIYTNCKSVPQSANTSAVVSETCKEFLQELYKENFSGLPSRKTSETKTECREFLEQIYVDNYAKDSRKPSAKIETRTDDPIRDRLLSKAEIGSVLTAEMCQEFLHGIYNEAGELQSESKSGTTKEVCVEYLRGYYHANTTPTKKSETSELTKKQCKDYLEEIYKEPSIDDEFAILDSKPNATQSERNITFGDKSKGDSKGSQTGSRSKLPHLVSNLAVSELFDPTEPILKELQTNKTELAEPKGLGPVSIDTKIDSQPKTKPQEQTNSPSPSIQKSIKPDTSSMKKKPNPEVETVPAKEDTNPKRTDLIKSLQAVYDKPKTVTPAPLLESIPKISNESLTYSAETPSLPAPRMSDQLKPSINFTRSMVSSTDTKSQNQSQHPPGKLRVAVGKPIDCWLLSEAKVWPATILSKKGFIWDHATKQIQVKEGDEVKLSCKLVNLKTDGVCSRSDPKTIEKSLIYLTDFFVINPLKDRFLITTQRLPKYLKRNCLVTEHDGRKWGEAYLRFDEDRTSGVLVKKNAETSIVAACIDKGAMKATIWERALEPKLRNILAVKEKKFDDDLASIIYTVENSNGEPTDMLVVPKEPRYPDLSVLLNGTTCKLFLEGSPILQGELKYQQSEKNHMNELQLWLSWKPEGADPWFTNIEPKRNKQSKDWVADYWTQERPRYLVIDLQGNDPKMTNRLHYKVKEWIYSLTKFAKGTTFEANRLFKNAQAVDTAKIICVSPKLKKDATFK